MSQQPTFSPPADDVACSHNHNRENVVPSVTYEPQGVGVELKPSAQAVKFSKLVFLGTGSAIPSPGRRNTSAIALQYSNSSLTLFDCGEGTQHQLMLTRSISASKISSILLTHLHGDHCFGLFGLLCTIGSNGRTEPMIIIGPKGVRRMVVDVLTLSGSYPCYPLHFLELEPDQSYPDLGLINGGVRVAAYPLTHRIASFGYILTEGAKPGALQVEEAKKRGAQGKQLAALKAGLDVTLEDGRVVRSEDVVGPSIRGRKIALLQDTADSSLALPAVKGADLLIHECTYSNALAQNAIDHGHSTSGMAGRFAAQAEVNMMMLTHFSNRYETSAQTAKRQAKEQAERLALEEEQKRLAELEAQRKGQDGSEGESLSLQELKLEDQSQSTAASPSPAPAAASSSSSPAVLTDVRSLAELVDEALVAFREAHPQGLSAPKGGIHAAEDFLMIESKQEQFIVAENKDRVSSSENSD